jgi:Skp family chaperone for outer membrane proteins
VKKFLLSSAVMAAILVVCFVGTCLVHSSAFAQPPMSPGMQAASPGVYLVDINYIFKKHVRLRAQLKELTEEGAKVQKGFEDQLRELQEQSKPLGPGGYKPGTMEYTQLEERLVKQKADIQAQIQLKRKDFIQREARLYFNAYREISEEVARYCQQRGIALVMNFNGDAIHDDNPEDVARGISNKVVFYNRALDLTPEILPAFVKQLPNTSPTAFNPGGAQR